MLSVSLNKTFLAACGALILRVLLHRVPVDGPGAAAGPALQREGQREGRRLRLRHHRAGGPHAGPALRGHAQGARRQLQNTG